MGEYRVAMPDAIRSVLLERTHNIRAAAALARMHRDAEPSFLCLAQRGLVRVERGDVLGVVRCEAELPARNVHAHHAALVSFELDRELRDLWRNVRHPVHAAQDLVDREVGVCFAPGLQDVGDGCDDRCGIWERGLRDVGGGGGEQVRRVAHFCVDHVLVHLSQHVGVFVSRELITWNQQ
eukprot:2053849-Rhodomonas_salina.2